MLVVLLLLVAALLLVLASPCPSAAAQERQWHGACTRKPLEIVCLHEVNAMALG